MKRVLLILGNPQNGKTSLAEELAKHDFQPLSVDDTYVTFIREKCQDLYFDKLNYFIKQHFECILNPSEYTIDRLKRDYVSEWHGHLLDLVGRESAQHDRLAVEGYLLVFSLDALEAKLKPSARVSVIRATNRMYRTIVPPLSLEETIALELESFPVAPHASND